MNSKQQNALREILYRLIQEQSNTMGYGYATDTMKIVDEAFPEVKEKI